MLWRPLTSCSRQKRTGGQGLPGKAREAETKKTSQRFFTLHPLRSSNCIFGRLLSPLERPIDNPDDFSGLPLFSTSTFFYSPTPPLLLNSPQDAVQNGTASSQSCSFGLSVRAHNRYYAVSGAYHDIGCQAWTRVTDCRGLDGQWQLDGGQSEPIDRTFVAGPYRDHTCSPSPALRHFTF